MLKHQLHSLISGAWLGRIYHLGEIKTVTLRDYFLGKSNDSLDILVLALRDIQRALFSDYGSFLNILLNPRIFFQFFWNPFVDYLTFLLTKQKQELGKNKVMDQADLGRIMPWVKHILVILLLALWIWTEKSIALEDFQSLSIPSSQPQSSGWKQNSRNTKNAHNFSSGSYSAPTGISEHSSSGAFLWPPCG